MEDRLFPELVHGEKVTLDGVITKGNQRANTIGFLYKEHVLNCDPDSGNIVKYKPALFLKCRIYGTITRIDEKGGFSAKRPKIIFSNIETIEERHTLWTDKKLIREADFFLQGKKKKFSDIKHINVSKSPQAYLA